MSRDPLLDAPQEVISGVPTAEYTYDAAGGVTEITRGADERTLSWDADDHFDSEDR